MMYMKYILIIILFTLSAAPQGYVIADGPDGYLVIPSIYLYKSIGFIPDSDPSLSSHYYNLDDLNYGIAHLEHTMWNSTVGGRTVLVGHTPGGFDNLKYVTLNNEIIIIMDNQEYIFTVFEIYVTHKSDNSIFSSPPDEFELVLITCVNDNERLIVKAK